MHGVSTRSVDDLVAAMGVESGVSKSEVSRICAGLDKDIEAFRTRSLVGHWSSAVVLQHGPQPHPQDFPDLIHTDLPKSHARRLRDLNRHGDRTNKRRDHRREAAVVP